MSKQPNRAVETAENADEFFVQEVLISIERRIFTPPRRWLIVQNAAIIARISLVLEPFLTGNIRFLNRQGNPKHAVAKVEVLP